MFGEEAICSRFEAAHKDHLEEGSIFKLNQKILLFLKWDLQISERQEKCMFSGMSSQTSACFSFAWFSLFDISFLTLPDMVIGLLLTFFTQWRK